MIAYLFPGQGSQHAGMGAGLLDDREVAELADRCSAAAGIDLRHLLLDADDEELRLTTNAQPALVFMGLGLALLLRRRGLEPAAAAGHSVGEYAALAVAGALPAEDAVRAVVERGRVMAAAAPPGTSSMVAVLGIGPEAVEAVLAGEPEAWPANYNTPTQTVVGGTVAGLERATPRLLAAGARRVLPLQVAAAFHTPLIAAAAAGFRLTLDRLAWRAPAIPVVANLDGRPYPGSAAMPDTLEAQLRSPVRWAGCVETLVGLGCDTFYEVGPRRALAGMMRELAPSASAAAVSNPAAVADLAAPAA